MDDLRNFNTDRLYSEILYRTDDEVIQWCVDHGLIHRTRTCVCGGQMTYKWRRVKKRNFPNWRCTSKVCRKERGFLKGKEEYGTARTHLHSYIAMFMWRKLFAGRDAF